MEKKNFPSNKNYQINFYDHQKFIFWDNGKQLTVILENKIPLTLELKRIFAKSHPFNHLLKRLKYCLLIMKAMSLKRFAAATNQNGNTT